VLEEATLTYQMLPLSSFTMLTNLDKFVIFQLCQPDELFSLTPSMLSHESNLSFILVSFVSSKVFKFSIFHFVTLISMCTFYFFYHLCLNVV
jgi:hypothetical protein